MYDPYSDIINLVNKQKGENNNAKAKLETLLKGNMSFYKSTYGDVKNSVNNTKSYIENGKAYSDDGAKAIREAYAVTAGNASDAAAADNAGDNGGNLDSYAAAQANRARRDYVSAGEEAVAKRAENVNDGLVASDKNLLSAFGVLTDAMGGSETALQKSQQASAQNDSDLIASAIKSLVSIYTKKQA